ncbi:MAG TPA: excinuclease ABC subunit A, partial [Pedococcus sp.]|nr:excinuclease ABC subunit A [Pedococcus sp.]
DIRKLLLVLQGLVDKGNTVIVIEHNLDVIKNADWIIDMGPEGGNGGGLVIAEGTPEEVAQVEGSHTGRFLAPVLAKSARTPTRATGSRATKKTAAASAATKRTATRTTASTAKKAATKKTAAKKTAAKKAPRSTR